MLLTYILWLRMVSQWEKAISRPQVSEHLWKQCFINFLVGILLEDQFLIIFWPGSVWKTHFLSIVYQFLFFCICSKFFAFFAHFELVLDLVWGLSGNSKSTPCLVRAPSRRAQSMEIMMETLFFAFFLFQKS